MPSPAASVATRISTSLSCVNASWALRRSSRPDAAVNDDDGLGAADEGANPLGQVVQRVAMLGEDDELAAMPVGVEHLGVVLEQPGELVPFAVGAGLPDPECELLQVGQQVDFGPKFRNGPGRRRLIDDSLLGLLDLGVRGVVEVFDVVG